jgi:uncharacterized protein (DUF934 family)
VREIIKDKVIVNDDWLVLRLSEGEEAATVAIPNGKVIVPLQVWLTQKPTLAQRGNVSVWLASHEQAKDVAEDLATFALIAIDFPKFADGRGYSIAYNLRARYGYKGELRAIGDVLRDQLFYMQRVGFNAFATRADKDIRDALKGLSDFSEAYQTSWDQKNPLFRRTHRTGAPQ